MHVALRMEELYVGNSNVKQSVLLCKCLFFLPPKTTKFHLKNTRKAERDTTASDFPQFWFMFHCRSISHRHRYIFKVRNEVFDGQMLDWKWN